MTGRLTLEQALTLAEDSLRRAERIRDDALEEGFRLAVAQEVERRQAIVDELRAQTARAALRVVDGGDGPEAA